MKLVTGALRIGVSARLAKTAVAALGDKEPDEIELVWHGARAALRGAVRLDRGPRREAGQRRSGAVPPGDAEPRDRGDRTSPRSIPPHFTAEWKWDGIRVQAVAGDADGKRVARLYSRTGEDISGAFPDLIDALDFDGAIDGELLILRDGRVQSFNVLQQRLNRKTVNAEAARRISRASARLRSAGRRRRGPARAAVRRAPRAARSAASRRLDHARIDLSPLVPFATWDELDRRARRSGLRRRGADAEAVEGVMLKRRDALYLPGRPKGLWWKWKRDPHVIDAVLMYAQRGHGKRSSFYSDYTFGVWTAGESGDELVPVGKAYFGFTDEELTEIDRYVRRNTVNRFGPVREVTHEADKGLVLEVAFEGLQRSTRHKSGVAMRFPRISRLRWDKPPREADRLETLERMLRCGAPASAMLDSVIMCCDDDRTPGTDACRTLSSAAFSAGRRSRWRSGSSCCASWSA